MTKVTESRGVFPKPAQDLVILRESELGGDLVSAIRRVRADAATQNSRILVIAPDDEVDAAPTAPIHDVLAQGRRVAETRALALLGDRLLPLTADLRHLLGETTRALRELDAGIDDGPRAALRHRAGSVAGVLEWVDAVAKDLEREAAACAEGRQPIDLVEVLTETGAGLERRRPGVRVQVTSVQGRGEWPAVDAACLAEFCAATLDLLADRIGGEGAIAVTVELDRHGATARLLGLGTKRRIRGGRRVAAIRRLAAKLGARLIPDQTAGPMGTGLGFSLGDPS